MKKRILIWLIVLMLLAVNASPTLAQKPPQANGQGNSDHTNHGDGNISNTNNGNAIQNNNNQENVVNPGISNTSISPSLDKALSKTNDFTKGFNEWGYNYSARIFNGTGLSWCVAKFGEQFNCASYMGDYANDKLIMKWNAEWDRGNDEEWSNGPYDAWENNQWNGKVPGGSGEVWHYKIVWVGPCGADYTPLENGGYCLWGQFEVLTDHGTAGGVHEWLTHAKPSGYGSYP